MSEKEEIRKVEIESNTTKIEEKNEPRLSLSNSASSNEARLRSEGRMDYESYMV